MACPDRTPRCRGRRRSGDFYCKFWERHERAKHEGTTSTSRGTGGHEKEASQLSPRRMEHPAGTDDLDDIRRHTSLLQLLWLRTRRERTNQQTGQMTKAETIQLRK